MVQGMEEINRKILTQFKLLNFSKKETERLLTRNKGSEIEKHLQHLESMLNKLEELSIQHERFYWTKVK